MKNVTNAYREAVASNREFLYEARLTFADGKRLTLDDKDDLMGDGISISAGTSGTESFDIGAAVIGELTMTLNNSTEKFDTYDFLDAQISLKIGLRLKDGAAEYLQMGIYTVEEAKAAETTIVLSALDKMSWFERKYSEIRSAYPKTLYGIVRDICDQCGVPLSDTAFPGCHRIIPERPWDEELTCLQMISYAAQMAGCYAKVDGEGRLTLRWYDISVFEEPDKLDGGKLKDAATGDDADGGDFTDYAAGDCVDGGSFIDQRRYAHIYAMGSLQVATDEIVITGVRVMPYEEEDLEDGTEEDAESTEDATEEDPGDGTEEGALYGNEGYVLLISGNPLIAKGMEASVAEDLGNKVIGMRVRAFSVSALSDPAIEAGDCAYISDRKGNSYPAYITNIIFKLGNLEDFSCGVQSPAENRAGNSLPGTEAIIRARKEIKKQFTAYDTAMQQLTQLMANSFGVFKTQERQPDGSCIYYMHDKPQLSESGTIWKIVSGAIAVSTDGGKSWNAGISADGNLALKVLSAIGINADWINAGEITSVSINIGDNSFAVDAGGNVKITKGSIDIGNGSFVVDAAGNVYLCKGSITIGGGAFSVDTNGDMISRNAKIMGEIVGRDGFSLAYVNENVRPVVDREFVFAGIGYDNPSDAGVGGAPFLDIYSPNGTRCIAMGTGACSDDAYGLPKLKDTAFFPNGAVIKKAYIRSLEETFEESGNITNGSEWVNLKIRMSGVFVCVYGTYHAYEQKAGEMKEIALGGGGLYTPAYSDVRDVSGVGKRIFIFRLTTDGKFTARNASEIDYSSESASGIKFRFDYIRF